MPLQRMLWGISCTKLMKLTVEEALARLGNDVPSGVVNHPRSKVLEDPQVMHNQMLFRCIMLHHAAPYFRLIFARRLVVSLAARPGRTLSPTVLARGACVGVVPGHHRATTLGVSTTNPNAPFPMLQPRAPAIFDGAALPQRCVN